MKFALSLGAYLSFGINLVLGKFNASVAVNARRTFAQLGKVASLSIR